MMEILKFKMQLLKNHLAFLKDQNEITSQLLTITEAAIRNNKKPSLFKKIIQYFKELLCLK